LVTGIALTISSADIPTADLQGMAVELVLRLLPLACVTIVATAAHRRWIIAHDSRTRRELQELTERQAQFNEECQRRTAELDAREARLTTQTEDSGAHAMRLVRRLDEALTGLAEVQAHYARLQTDHADLARTHNQLVRETLQERADGFARRTFSPSVRRAAMIPQPVRHETPVRQYADPNGGHTPVTPIPLRLPTQTNQAEPAQHDRAEGVGPA
jgi:Skp family chaperone for outer membrane proteins